MWTFNLSCFYNDAYPIHMRGGQTIFLYVRPLMMNTVVTLYMYNTNLVWPPQSVYT